MFVDYLAKEFSLPLFVTQSPSGEDLRNAEPAGELTPTEKDTLAVISNAGGRMSASDLASKADLQLTAALNRLSSLARKGYVYRVRRPGREGDLFVDPRMSKQGVSGK